MFTDPQETTSGLCERRGQGFASLEISPVAFAPQLSCLNLLCCHLLHNAPLVEHGSGRMKAALVMSHKVLAQTSFLSPLFLPEEQLAVTAGVVHS